MNSRAVRFHVPLIVLSLVGSAYSDDVPKIFEGLFEQDVSVKAQIGEVRSPQEIDKYVAKIQSAGQKDPKWFREFSKLAKPSEPMTYDERLGLTRTEYEEYLVLWSKREFIPKEDVVLLLHKSVGDTWTLNATGAASTISTMHYSAKGDIFRSPNGELKRVDDIKADPTSILGVWSGPEWKLEEDTGLGKIKENIALGRFTDNKNGIIVYRAQEFSEKGTRLLDKSLVVRFTLGEAGHVKEAESSPISKAVGKFTPAKPWENARIVVSFQIGKDGKPVNTGITSMTVAENDADRIANLVLSDVGKTNFSNEKVGKHKTVTYEQLYGSFKITLILPEGKSKGEFGVPLFNSGSKSYKFYPGASKFKTEDLLMGKGRNQFRVLGRLDGNTLSAAEVVPVLADDPALGNSLNLIKP